MPVRGELAQPEPERGQEPRTSQPVPVQGAQQQEAREPRALQPVPVPGALQLVALQLVAQGWEPRPSQLVPERVPEAQQLEPVLAEQRVAEQVVPAQPTHL